MKGKDVHKRRAHNPSCVRASISFPPDLYATLEEKVSLGWVVRDASEQYVAGQRPRSRKLSA